MTDIFVKLRFLLPTLPRAEKAVAKYIINTPESVRSVTLNILANETKSSEASIIRLSRRLGFDGFTSLKQALMFALVDQNPIVTQEILPDDSISSIMAKLINDTNQILRDTRALVNKDYDRALDALLTARSSHFFGMGDAFAVAQLAHMKFSRLGIGGSAHSDVMLQCVTAASLSPGDVAFGISFSGASSTTVQAIRLAKEAGATTICITQMNKSPLMKYADISLFTATADLTVGKDIISRRVADQAIIDALYLAVLAKTEETSAPSIRKTQKAIDHNML
ncbi:MAG: MurR/RpiR family transcriptional regulator [Planctomycetota bacterium]|jgi:DNA-binding MurR/RpiR family transcriptional regulator|nr:MurR/RpiR family transcriptional regulator [Planctomycetota bacterium]